MPTATGATISWNTNEPASSQVEFGTTSAYGSSSTLDTAMMTAHSVTLSALAPGVLYHYRVKSRDAADNLATGTDLTFTTTNSADTVAPSVAITAPAANATVDGQVSVTASASDDVGVAGVQFRLDGSALGTEDASAPYSVSWDTTGVANGGHTLTAVARDAAGNQTLSAAVNVTVSNGAADTTPPTVSLTAPANNATLSGTVTVAASAADDVGVIGVQFQLDGAALKTEDLTSPYSISWDTTSATQGAHVLSAVARDAAGNQTTSASVSLTVDNAPPPNGAAISVGQIVVDPPTLEVLGVSLPITSGDTNHNATVNVSYRRSGDTTWLSALPLLRVRPELLSQEDPTPFNVPEQFAGSIFDLAPDTEYEILLDVQDPDGGSTTRTATARTRPTPLANPTTPRTVSVSNLSQLNTALSNAQPGDVITLANGTYSGAITLAHSGNASNPIFIRGASRDGVIINATGAAAGITVSGSYITVEDLTIQNSSWGMYLNNQGGTSSNVVVRRLKITNVSYGIQARFGQKRDYYICDNLLQGKVQWPKIDNTVWDFEGIVMTGAGHVICYNTLSGFGDAMGLHHETDMPNRAIDFYGNDVLWTGDNGIELDFTERNVRAFRNRITNGGNQSISFQPVYGGPAYAFRNVIYNSGTSPFKFNNEPTGIIVLHNTALRPGTAWVQLGARADNIIFENNLLIGTGQPVNITTDFSLEQIDYNGWWRDGTFSFSNGSWSSFASLQSNSPYEHNGRLLNDMPFATPVSIPADYTTKVAPLDVSLNAGSNAVDGGVRLPNINDGFAGANPDLGALELGAPPPHYGVRYRRADRTRVKGGRWPSTASAGPGRPHSCRRPCP
ncbi:MAG TPA: Ig-like domain-containing protein [Steroidobacteraceae bacterium]